MPVIGGILSGRFEFKGYISSWKTNITKILDIISPVEWNWNIRYLMYQSSKLFCAPWQLLLITTSTATQIAYRIWGISFGLFFLSFLNDSASLKRANKEREGVVLIKRVQSFSICIKTFNLKSLWILMMMGPQFETMISKILWRMQFK